DHRSPPVVLASLVELADLPPLRLKLVIKSASADPISDLLSDLVDGFEDGRAPAGLQHAVDFPNGRLLVGEVDQYRTCHHHVDALGGQREVRYVAPDAGKRNDTLCGPFPPSALSKRVDREIEGRHVP